MFFVFQKLLYVLVKEFQYLLIYHPSTSSG